MAHVVAYMRLEPQIGLSSRRGKAQNRSRLANLIAVYCILSWLANSYCRPAEGAQCLRKRHALQPKIPTFSLGM